MNPVVLASGCKPWPASGPVTFQPGTCYSFAPHAAPWHITFAALGWVIAVWLIAGLTLAGAINWFSGQYEVTWKPLRIARRWYGIRARVILRDEAEQDEPERFKVLEVDTEDSDIPWLKVGSVDFAADEDAEPFWGPVTDFYPEAVRRLRPWIFRYRWLRIPVLFAYKPWPSPGRPSGWPADTLPGIRGRRLELTRIDAGRWALFRNCASPAHSVAADMDHTAAREWASALLGRDVEWVNATDAPDERCGYWVADPAESGSA
jgi:hypothetical protein